MKKKAIVLEEYCEVEPKIDNSIPQCCCSQPRAVNGYLVINAGCKIHGLRIKETLKSLVDG